MMKNSKLKFSEYVQNINRSKSFGKFVLIVLSGMFSPTVPLLSTLKWSLDFHDFLAKNLPLKASISSELTKEKIYFSSFLQYLIVLYTYAWLTSYPIFQEFSLHLGHLWSHFFYYGKTSNGKKYPFANKIFFEIWHAL